MGGVGQRAFPANLEEEPGDLHYGTRSDLTGSDRITVNTAKHFEASYEGEKVNILIKH